MDNKGGKDKKSPHSSSKLKAAHGASDSDASAETNSLSAESATELVTAKPKSKKDRRRSSEWEIMEGLKEGQKFEKKPGKFDGYLHKKRKWPLKGWHKRFFVLDKGILVYGKGPAEIKKGKLHGSVDIGLSVISSKVKRRRLDIDTEEFIYHLKAKTEDVFNNWVQQLTAHRLYRQHILSYGTKTSSIDDRRGSFFKRQRKRIRKRLTRGRRPSNAEIPLTPEIVASRDGSLTRGLKPIGASSGARIATWLLDIGPTLEKLQRDTSAIDANISRLTQLIDSIELHPFINSANIPSGETESLAGGLSPNIKKDRRKFGLKKKKSSSSKGGSVDLSMTFNRNINIEPDSTSPLSINSSSGISIVPQMTQNSGFGGGNTGGGASSAGSDTMQPSSLPGDFLTVNTGDRISSGTPDNHLREDFVYLAKNVIKSLKDVTFDLCTERDRLKAALEAETNYQASMNGAGGVGGASINSSIVTTLKTSLNIALQQNAELKNRLNRVHDVSDLADLSSLDPVSDTHRPYNASLSYSSSCVSGSEFFDAEELAHDKEEKGGRNPIVDLEAEVQTRGSDSSSEAGSLSSGEGSISSESELGVEFNAATNSFIEFEGLSSNNKGLTGRRTALPAPRPDTEGLSLWNILRKNIGKDLSQISMPVALNEPLNMLQRLCEELEYSELLDKASELDDPYERMVQIAAFAVSAYASSFYRAGNKPFNPLLGETYECIREDKGFRFLAEQVSHHPPISACHAESRNFTFWQEARIKTKFWGKSMEFQPMGKVHVLLSRTGDLYSWNKVTTCVHNVFGGQRWVDQYGELHITNGRISCKLTFNKASYWSAKRHEVVGAVFDESGNQVFRLFGKWSEALYCGVPPAARCIWRAGTMPPDHERYYGFTRFAMELNELGPDSQLLPNTDSRLRPDQRALEEGDLNAAESLKLQLESAQRDRRKKREEIGTQWEPRWFSHKHESSDDVWEYNGKYWESRKNPGFSSLIFENLW